ncbi:MAG: HAD family hydrolase [Patescibacteria group bacterium]|jgi:HAD superfamily hydrolase (TIGR01509 family)
MITTIAFDVGNVLVNNGNFPRSIMKGISQALDIPLGKLVEKYDQLLPRMEAGNEKIYFLVGKRLYPVLKDLYQDAAKNIFELNIELFNIAQDLKKNFKVGILSNIDQYLAQIPVHLELYNSFDPKLVVLSYKVKLRKPDPEIYRLFLKKAKSLPEECLFVDDKKDNIETARKLGMKAILFKNNLQFKKELFKYLLPIP